MEAILRTGESLTVTVPAGQGEDALFAPGMETLGQLTHLARQLGIDYTVKSAEYQRPFRPPLHIWSSSSWAAPDCLIPIPPMR